MASFVEVGVVKFDDKAREALRKVQKTCEGDRELIRVLTQFRVNAYNPGDPNWGKPSPIDISGLIEMAFAEGIRYANSQMEPK